MAVDPMFQEDLIAELAALNTAVMRALSALAALAEDGGVPRKLYLERILESGIRDIAKTHFWSIPEDRREAVVEKARARFTDIISGIHH